MKTKRITLMGVLFALACILSLLEGMIPTAGLLPPGAKLGLSNMITMYVLLMLHLPSAVYIAVLKALFVLLTRGVVASFMSLAGGLLSVFVMAILIHTPRVRFSYYFISICGAMMHNLAQCIASALLLKSFVTFAYLPILLLAGIVMGYVTGLVFRYLLPALQKIQITDSIKTTN